MRSQELPHTLISGGTLCDFGHTIRFSAVVERIRSHERNDRLRNRSPDVRAAGRAAQQTGQVLDRERHSLSTIVAVAVASCDARAAGRVGEHDPEDLVALLEPSLMIETVNVAVVCPAANVTVWVFVV